MKNDIILALKKLDVEDNSLWTQDGLPKVEALGIEGLSRKDIVDAAPQFTRQNPTVELPEVALLGSNVQPDSFELKDGSTITLEEVVKLAVETSGLTAEDWNKLVANDSETAEKFIQDEVDKLELPSSEDPELDADNADGKTEELTESEIEADNNADEARQSMEKDDANEEGLQEEKVEGQEKEEVDLDSERRLLQDAIDEANTGVIEAQNELARANAAMDVFLKKNSHLVGGTTTQQDIVDHIKGQNELRYKKALARKSLTDLGITPEMLAPAPLEAAMARKKGKGRPQRTPKINK